MEPETNMETPKEEVSKNNLIKNNLSIPLSIVIAAVIIAGAIYLSFTSSKEVTGVPVTTLAPISAKDNMIGNPNAKVVLVMYADFQCPFCSAVTGLQPNSPAVQYLKNGDPKWTPFMPEIMNNYVKTGNVLFVYRDWPFLGPESIKSAEAARCAGDQGKFWEYHDYLYTNQGGENKGDFSDTNLKSFAKKLDLDSAIFDKCLDEGKYTNAVAEAKKEGTKAGVKGTPKGFILKDSQIVDVIDGAESLFTVKEKIENALK